jgi:hypothetical protein
MALDSHVLAREHQNRPLDQRFLSLPEIHAYNVAKKERSVERGVALKHLRLAATDSGDIAIASERGSNATSGAVQGRQAHGVRGLVERFE